MGQHGGKQTDTVHHGGNQPGEDHPRKQPDLPQRGARPDVSRPGSNIPGGSKPPPGPDPDKPGGRY
ncbi:MAG TPA: hypothetical protein VLA73_11765 [Burkholderiales bacterium]|nr:hypothetical protein [Burkholderiales bacterium]